MRKKKIRLRPLGWLILVVLPVCLLVLLLLLGLRSCTRDVELTEALGIPVYILYVQEGDEARPQITRRIKYIVLHETGNEKAGADAKRHAIYLRYTSRESTSWHYTVDEKEIYHHIPDDEVAWHASDQLQNPGGNLNGIGIELCVNSDGDFEKTFDNAARLVAVLLDTYGLEIDDIRQHADFTGKNCPERIRNGDRMDEFRIKVNEYLEKIQ